MPEPAPSLNLILSEHSYCKRPRASMTLAEVLRARQELDFGSVRAYVRAEPVTFVPSNDSENALFKKIAERANSIVATQKRIEEEFKREGKERQQGKMKKEKIKLKTDEKWEKRKKEIEDMTKPTPCECSCSICKKNFPDLDYLLFHRKLYHGKNAMLTCDHCNLSFGNEYAIKQHLAVLYGLFRCGVCKNAFSTLHYLNAHFRNGVCPLIDERPSYIHCNICSREFATIARLLSHRKKQHGSDMMLQCGFCEKTFSSYQRAVAHLNKEFGFYDCEKCGQGFEGRPGKRAHELKCSGTLLENSGIIHTCNICADHFTTISEIVDHRLREHGKTEMLTCWICGFIFKTKCLLEHHVNKEMTLYPCRKCGWKCVDKKYHIYHENMCKDRSLELGGKRTQVEMETTKEKEKEDIFYFMESSDEEASKLT